MFSERPDSRKYRKCFPSGTKTGVECPVSWRDTLIVVSGEAAPPAADTRHVPPPKLPKMMTPSRFHEPPVMKPLLISQIVCGGPPDTSTFISLFSASPPGNATNRLSGDHVMDGEGPVSARRRDSPDSNERTHMLPAPSAPT